MPRAGLGRPARRPPGTQASAKGPNRQLRREPDPPRPSGRIAGPSRGPARLSGGSAGFKPAWTWPRLSERAGCPNRRAVRMASCPNGQAVRTDISGVHGARRGQAVRTDISGVHGVRRGQAVRTDIFGVHGVRRGQAVRRDIFERTWCVFRAGGSGFRRSRQQRPSAQMVVPGGRQAGRPSPARATASSQRLTVTERCCLSVAPLAGHPAAPGCAGTTSRTRPARATSCGYRSEVSAQVTSCRYRSEVFAQATLCEYRGEASDPKNQDPLNARSPKRGSSTHQEQELSADGRSKGRPRGPRRGQPRPCSAHRPGA